MGVDVRKVIQELVVPELQEIKSDVRVIKVDIRRLDDRINSVEKRIDDLAGQIRGMREEFKVAIDIHERLAAVEAKLGAK